MLVKMLEEHAHVSMSERTFHLEKELARSSVPAGGVL